MVATLHCRLQAVKTNVPTASYVRSDFLKKGVQTKIQEQLRKEFVPNIMANQALITSGHFGLDPESRDPPPLPQRFFHTSLIRPWTHSWKRGNLPSSQQLATMRLPPKNEQKLSIK